MGSIAKMRHRNTYKGLKRLCMYLNEKYKIATMVEVGSYAGESARIFSFMTNAIIFCVDPWMGNSMSIVEERFDYRTKDDKNIVKIKKKSSEAHLLFEDESLDFVYIDANHTYESVKEDITLWLPKVKKGCYIGGHDYKQRKYYGVEKAVLELLGEPEQTFIDTSWVVMKK
jgi:predicted O-methyltransferase YrrM